ncbi:Nn.00g092550.m01.CDS01 [Neocucurbitaria sp. VM-36]
MAVAHLQAILTCITCAEPEGNISPGEKLALLRADNVRPATAIADDVVDTLLHTALVGPALHMQLDSIVGAYGWKENIAQWVLEKLSLALQNGHEKLGPAVRDAYHKAWEVARSTEGFVIEHPIMCTIIALGVLVVIAPWVLEALGFAELGPIEGTFASWWQSTYGGLVPKGSLFSFFQRLGMTWHLLSI